MNESIITLFSAIQKCLKTLNKNMLELEIELEIAYGNLHCDCSAAIDTYNMVNAAVSWGHYCRPLARNCKFQPPIDVLFSVEGIGEIHLIRVTNICYPHLL